MHKYCSLSSNNLLQLVTVIYHSIRKALVVLQFRNVTATVPNSSHTTKPDVIKLFCQLCCKAARQKMLMTSCRHFHHRGSEDCLVVRRFRFCHFRIVGGATKVKLCTPRNTQRSYCSSPVQLYSLYGNHEWFQCELQANFGPNILLLVCWNRSLISFQDWYKLRKSRFQIFDNTPIEYWFPRIHVLGQHKYTTIVVFPRYLYRCRRNSRYTIHIHTTNATL